MKITYLTLILFLISITLVQGIQVVKESPQEIRLNEIIEIEIHISNPSNTEKEFTIEEVLPQNIEVIKPTKVFTKRNDGLTVNYYEWITKVSPNKIKTITYKIKPLSLGEYTLGSTQVIDNSNLETSESNQITFNVNCISNNICDENENSITCSEDCSAGSSDGICDYKADGICDPDCEEEPDCKKSKIKVIYFIIPFILIILIILLLWLFRKKDFKPIKKINPVQPQKTTPKDPLSGI
tara:strand:+ start:649 stop:1365 length:717 start_codon:yes stop_codon:yes gene_type:complete